MFAYIFSLLGNRTQAEDVMQETNAILWRKAHEFKLGTNFGAWMLRVAYFQVMAHRRRLTRDRLVFDDDFLQGIAAEAEQQSELQEENNAFWAAVSRSLTNGIKKLFAFAISKEPLFKTMATLTGRSENSIKQALLGHVKP